MPDDLAPSTWLRADPGTQREPLAPHCIWAPHAGGNARSYEAFARSLAPTLRCSVVAYPLRHERIGDPPFADLRAAADRLAAALARLADGPLVLGGHSMGATVAFETARALRRHGREVTALVVSARPAPAHGSLAPAGRDPGDAGGRVRTDAEILRDVGRLASTRERALYRDREFLRLVLPTLRHDFGALDRHVHVPGEPLTCPVVAVAGRADPVAPPRSLAGWADQTTGPFTLVEVDGDHFVPLERPAAVARRVVGALAPHLPPRPPEAVSAGPA